jgi:hypothetical protein
MSGPMGDGIEKGDKETELQPGQQKMLWVAVSYWPACSPVSLSHFHIPFPTSLLMVQSAFLPLPESVLQNCRC